MHNFTLDHLLLYYYGECSPEMAEDISIQLNIDERFNTEWKELKLQLGNLESLHFDIDEQIVIETVQNLFKDMNKEEGVKNR